jgi:hypothetical protein
MTASGLTIVKAHRRFVCDLETQPRQPFSSAQTHAMAVIRPLQDQELMAQGNDFSLQSCPSSQAGWRGEKQGDEKGKHGSGSLHAPALQI